MFALVLLAFLATTTFNQVSAEILDLDGNPDMELLLRATCQNFEDVQISRMSTVVKLTSFLESEPDSCPENPELINILRSLKMLVESGNDDVCSLDKISAVIDFHRRYIQESSCSGSSSRIPYTLSLFFKYYASELSAICKRSLITNLIATLPGKFTDLDYQFGRPELFDKLSSSMDAHLGPITSDNYFDDVILIWDIIRETLLRKYKSEMSDYIETDTKENSDDIGKVFIKRKENKDIVELQTICETRFRPTYEKLVLPVLKLAYLGYSAKFGSISGEAEQLKEDPLAKRWFRIVQICEMVRPIKVFADSTLNEGDVTLVTKEEAKQLESEQSTVDPAEVVELEVIKFKMDQDLLYSVESVNPTELSMSINKTKKIRSSAVSSFLKKLSQKLQSGMKDKAIEYLSSLRVVGGLKKMFWRTKVDSVGPEMKDLSSEQILKKLGADQTSCGLMRRRRATEGGILMFVMIIGFMALMLTYAQGLIG